MAFLFWLLSFKLKRKTLGTALGDWTADSAGLVYAGAAYVFSSGLLLFH